MKKLVLIDNFDSFTYNLVDLLSVLGAAVTVLRNNVSLETITARQPDCLVISPGPGAPPDDTGVTIEAIRHLAGQIPILGVCLGHQAIGQAFGGRIVSAKQVMHGKTSPVSFDTDAVFSELPQVFSVGRYHSLVVDSSTLPSCLKPIAISADDREIMALRHRTLPNVIGIQFHPESILTAGPNVLDVHQGFGAKILANFLAL